MVRCSVRVVEPAFVELDGREGCEVGLYSYHVCLPENDRVFCAGVAEDQEGVYVNEVGSKDANSF